MPLERKAGTPAGGAAVGGQLLDGHARGVDRHVGMEPAFERRIGPVDLSLWMQHEGDELVVLGRRTHLGRERLPAPTEPQAREERQEDAEDRRARRAGRGLQGVTGEQPQHEGAHGREAHGRPQPDERHEAIDLEQPR